MKKILLTAALFGLFAETAATADVQFPSYLRMYFCQTIVEIKPSLDADGKNKTVEKQFTTKGTYMPKIAAEIKAKIQGLEDGVSDSRTYCGSFELLQNDPNDFLD